MNREATMNDLNRQIDNTLTVLLANRLQAGMEVNAAEKSARTALSIILKLKADGLLTA